MLSVSQKKIYIIVGPTAIGKTQLAISLAKELHTEIISADSRQCYNELNIGVAKPSIAQLAEVPHHFINTHSLHDNVSAALFETYALQKCEELFLHNDVIVMVGGTGLYINAFCNGLDYIPPVPQRIQQEILCQYQMGGITYLQEQIKLVDPWFWDVGEIKNPHRIIRALGVKLLTGRSILSYQTAKQKVRPFDIITIGLYSSKKTLHERIMQRTNDMFQQGLIEEVKKVRPYKDMKSLQTVGYTEVFCYLDGLHDLETTKQLVSIHTKQYAKRQLTWFRKNKKTIWFDIDNGFLQDDCKDICNQISTCQ
ncbi:MAG: tRNA (adenosine(37)-N6)-dimethylallyltransferase MiaA [Phycisphaerales bacterium]|nr:tRNA (adenosine(37)-N6)-dimethylallyltransferase MiaA [Phycisphaerales bacterium]